MRPISFSLIAVLSLACENTALDSTYIDSQLVDPELFTLEFEEQEDTMSGIPSLVLPGIELEAQEDEPKVPEWDNEKTDPEADEPEEEVQEPEAPVVGEEGAAGGTAGIGRMDGDGDE